MSQGFFQAEGKMEQIRNLHLHKEWENTKEGINEGKTKSSFSYS